MWRLPVFFSLLLAGLFQALRLHVPFFNDKGSPKRDEPYLIDQPEMSKAFYGRLGEGDDEAYFRFTAPAGHVPALMLLVPKPSYVNKGLRVSMRLFGPGLPEEGMTFESTEHFMKIVGHDYAIIQNYPETLEQEGDYLVRVERTAGLGTYCFCMGNGETRKIPRELFTRVDEIILRDE